MNYFKKKFKDIHPLGKLLIGILMIIYSIGMVLVAINLIAVQIDLINK